MRWPNFGRESRRSETAADRSGAQAAPASSSAAPESRTHAWAALPPITGAWSERAPLTAPPPTSSTIPLTERQPPPRSAASGDGAPEPGRIEGLAAVRPAIATAPGPEPRAELPAYFREQPPLRHATPRIIVEHPALTRATDEYVGEPLAPPPAPPRPTATPRPAPAPMPQPPIEAMTEAGARFREALANLHNSGHPRYEQGVGAVQTPGAPAQEFPPPPAARPEPRAEATTEAGARFREALANLHSSGHPRYEPASGTPEDAPPAARPAAGADPGPVPAGPRLVHRRTLAESRKLGLGAPVPGVPAAEVAAEPALPAAAEPIPGRPDSMLEALEAVKHAAEAAQVAAAATAQAPAAAPPLALEAPRPAPPPRVVARPIVDGTTHFTATAAPLVFRSAPRPAASEASAPVPRAVVTRPPAQLASALRASHGIDVVDVPIRRDSEVEREATERRARAFTRGATVHLPESAGSLTSSNTLGLLAHELVHAAQQRRLGGNLPPEASPEGRVLEAEALAAERAHGGAPPSLTSDEPLRHAPPPVSASWVEDRVQHALGEHVEPNPNPFKDRDNERDAIKFYAAEIVKEATGGGGTLGGGGGGGAAHSALDKVNIGGTGATNEQEFRAILLQEINRERGMQGLPALTALTADHAAWAHAQYVQAEKEREAALARDKVMKEAVAQQQEAAKKLEEAKKKEAQEAAEQAESTDKVAKKAAELQNIAWTPKDGFHKPDGSSARAQVAAALTAFSATEDGSAEQKEAAQTAAAISVKVSGGRTTAPGVGSAKLTETEKWELKKDNDLFTVDVGDARGLRTAAEYIAVALTKVNMERGMRGLPPLDRLDPAFEQDLTFQFNTIMQAAIDDARRKAEEADRVEALNKAALEKKKSELEAQGHEAQAAKPQEAALVQQAAAASPAAADHSAAATAMAPVLPHELESHHLEELTQRIYDRLRSRLRTELLVDRERAGLLTDFR